MTAYIGISKQYNKAKQLKKLKRWKEALHAYDRLLNHLDEDAATFLKHQKEKVAKGDIKGALRVALDGATANPSSTVLRSQSVLVNLLKKRFQKKQKRYGNSLQKKKPI